MKRRLAIAIVLVAGGAVGSAFFSFQGFSSDVYVDLERGMSSPAIARELARAGVVRFSWQFLIARALRPKVRLQAGEYRFARPASAVDVLDRIARGDVYYYELSVPEGANMFDIAASLDKLGGVSGADFLAAAADPAPIRDVAPEAPSLEGYLFPSTYRLTRRTTAVQLVTQMTAEFRKHWKSAAGGNDAAVHRTMTIASLVEKETALEAERPLVASVFSNRLRIGMKLDCDPTVIYARLLEGRFRGAIYRSDLANHHPYNTYERAGLPPGPIANPGAASIQAALHPAETNYLYFVANPGGGHQFSALLAAHEKAVSAYRRGQKKNNKKR